MRLEEKEYTKSFDYAIWKRIFPFLKPYKKTVVMILIMNFFCSLIDIILPLFQRFAINHFIEGNTLSGIGIFAVVYIAAIALQGASVIAFTRGSMRIEMSLGKDMKRALFVHLQTLSFSYYNVTPVGYMLSRVMNDTGKIAGLIAWNFVDLLWALTYVLGVFVAMFFLNWKLALIIMLVVPAIALLTYYFQNRILKWNRQVRKINSRITSAYNEGIMGAKTAKSLVVEEKTYGEFQEITGEMRTASIRAARPVRFTFRWCFSAALLQRPLSWPEAACRCLNMPCLLERCPHLRPMRWVFSSRSSRWREIWQNLFLHRPISSVSLVFWMRNHRWWILSGGDRKVRRQLFSKKENWEPIRGDIEFRDVSFHYPDGKEEILSHFNLKIPAGTNVAIVGETGCRKVVPLRIWPAGFLNRPADRSSLTERTTGNGASSGCTAVWVYVLQNPHLFSGSVMENIRYGRLDATDEEVVGCRQGRSCRSGGGKNGAWLSK